ncbi:type VI secretion system contractile sheath small subunit [Francisellaceae bacterium]|jgi:type VI secretion system protein ImpB|nr:type VI secretion system contractile sheath small subunit [Francisellaceae bacterium]
MAQKEGTVAPKERINIKYKPHGNMTEEKELPLKLLMVGDYTLREDDSLIEERKQVSINKHNFNDVMQAHNLEININTPNRIDDKADEDEELPVNLKFNKYSDFNPDAIVEQVPELRKLKELRDTLVALKSPLGNVPKFRKKLQAIITDPKTRESLCNELGIKPSEEDK